MHSGLRQGDDRIDEFVERWSLGPHVAEHLRSADEETRSSLNLQSWYRRPQEHYIRGAVFSACRLQYELCIAMVSSFVMLSGLDWSPSC